MVTKKIFGIIGGDFRQIYLAKKFYNDDNKVFLCGFDKLKVMDEFLYLENLHDTIAQSDYVILPTPATRNGISVNAPLSKSNIVFDNKILELLKEKTVFGDLTKFTKNIDSYRSHNYSKSEEFQILNAVPTAEGALKTALEMKNHTLFKSKCLISGFGRIGKILANRLEKFSADITITDRNNTNLVWAYTLGYNCTPMGNPFNKSENYDFIFNTVPHIIFNHTLLKKCDKNTLIIDLASEPGGIDKAAADKLDINYTHELGIPGRMFPETAANIIYYSIQKIIEEKIL